MVLQKKMGYAVELCADGTNPDFRALLILKNFILILFHPPLLFFYLFETTMKFLAEIYDFFIPRFCASCGTKLKEYDEVLCFNCEKQLLPAGEERIQREYSRKFEDEKIIDDFFPLYVFEKEKELQDIIHGLKYKKKFKSGLFLGRKLAGYLQDRFPEIDLIVPVPLHHLKKAERGYNQSFYIARGAGRISKIKVAGILKRTRFTQSQTKMNLTERRNNMAGAFKLKRRYKVTGKNILLLDDVITTGATVSECGRVLKEAGANKIYAASVAIAD